MENLKWVAYEEFTYALNDSDDDEVKANDTTESSETDDKTDEEISARSSEEDAESESAECEDEGSRHDEINQQVKSCQNISLCSLFP